MNENNIEFVNIGNTTFEQSLQINFNYINIVNSELHLLNSYWDKPSFILENKQSNLSTSLEEHTYFSNYKLLQEYKINSTIYDFCCNKLI